MRGNVIGLDKDSILFKVFTGLKVLGITLFMVYIFISLINIFENFRIIFNFIGLILGSIIACVGWGFTVFHLVLKGRGMSSKSFFRYGWKGEEEEGEMDERTVGKKVQSFFKCLKDLICYLILNDEIDLRPKKGEDRYLDLFKKIEELEEEIDEDNLMGLEAISPQFWSNDV
ncbi:hypothetical protein TrLO_g3950 [Triparma laevis f. longispina]|uniref:Uncharacterized protein n=1 Tax=Triparma laevis f. longispina TaxID=1714387 RepID=A0A9W7FU46_9STRA|nr:hypothetical protein TrLO_g3950 [Triparma laevis f. longispina]